MTRPGRALIKQFERAAVRDWTLEMQLALKEKSERTGDRLTDADPLPPATTGPVTITADADLLEELARALLDFNEQDHDDYEVENEAGESMLEQLDKAR